MRSSRNASAELAMFVALLAASFALSATASAAGLAAAYCGAGAGSGDRPLPPELAAAAAQALGLDAAIVGTGAYYRCSNRRLLVCAVGANLWCGKAETDAKPAAVAAYCRRHPDAAMAPMAVTGHATIYAWRCARGVPQIEPSPQSVDPDGYIADNWRELD